MPRQHVTRNIPEDIISVLSVDEWLYNSRTVFNASLSIASEEDGCNSDDGGIAPFVYVKQYHVSENEDYMGSNRPTRGKLTDGKQGTIVDFEPVATVIKEVLCAVSSCPTYHHREEGVNLLFDGVISPSNLSKLPSLLCSISYTILSLLLSHGMAFPGMNDLLWLGMNSSPDVCDGENELAFATAAADYSGVLGYVVVSNIGNKNNNLILSRRICNVLIQLSKSNDRKVVQHACCGLISILSSLRHSLGERSTKVEMYDTVLSDCAVEYVSFVLRALNNRLNPNAANDDLRAKNSDEVLIPLIDGVCCLV